MPHRKTAGATRLPIIILQSTAGGINAYTSIISDQIVLRGALW